MNHSNGNDSDAQRHQQLFPPPPEAFASIKNYHLNHTEEKEIISDCVTESNGQTSDPQEQIFNNENERTPAEEAISFQSNTVTRDLLEPGDHVYAWKYYGVPLYQCHGIIYSVSQDRSEIVVATFNAPQPINRENYKSKGTCEDLKVLLNIDIFDDSSTVVQKVPLEIFTKGKQLYRVQYSASLVSRVLKPAGTVTSMEQDQNQVVLARVNYLIENPGILPKFDMITCNCECVSVWCSTGHFTALQSSSMLKYLGVCQANGAVITSSLVASTSVGVPKVVMGGMFLTTCKIPLYVAFPAIIPFLVAYGAMSLLPFEILRRCKGQWNNISNELNRELCFKVRQDEIADTAYNTNLVIQYNAQISTVCATQNGATASPPKKSWRNAYEKVKERFYRQKKDEDQSEFWGDVEIPDWHSPNMPAHVHSAE